MRNAIAPHLKRQAIDLAHRAQASDGDMGFGLETFKGDPTKSVELLRFWRWRVADRLFYSFFPEGFILNGPGDAPDKAMRVFIGGREVEREDYASADIVGCYFAGTFPVADLALPAVPADGQLELLEVAS